MATSKVEIANMALSSYVGKKRINALDESSSAAEEINLHYASVRREMLEEWPWAFAIRREKLAQLAFNDRPEWAFKYAAPNGMIAIRWVNEPATAKAAIEERETYDTGRNVIDGFIYSDEPDAMIEYVEDVDDPTKYPAKFTAAFVALLASRVAYPLTETQSKMDRAEQAYVVLLDEAKVADLRLSPPIKILQPIASLTVR